MPALRPTDHVATVRWLGRVPDRGTGLASVPVPEIELTFAGITGESHSGLTRASCSRVTAQHRGGTEIRNTRQISILSAEEIAAIAAAMSVGALDPTWLGASLVIEGIDDFSHVPPSSRLQGEAGTTLVVDMENRPCVLPGRVIEEALPGKGALFLAAARGRRGVTAWVEREGRLRLGERLRLHVPDQPAWAPGVGRVRAGSRTRS
ncbi:MAG: MOSC domain-containing protein [Albidovulum sp.]|uniref:MOSC domain-containing protein n=1 Tax=Albidovulum sp. TaxID=1872424 RepID=UPI0013252FEB|nr:MOSC domain-containing protein [Defluviimonas sp.]KAB2885681.1 MAG: MOSC domain-containing protein [Defluviimonas sp.]